MRKIPGGAKRGQLRRLAGRDLPRAGREHEADGVDIGLRGRATASALVMPQILIHMARSVAI